jgi:hypothetical protein
MKNKQFIGIQELGDNIFLTVSRYWFQIRQHNAYRLKNLANMVMLA